MKKVLISIITPFVLLLASTYFLRQPTHPGMQLSADMQNTLAAEADTLPNDSMPDFGDEFEYSRKNHGNGLMPEGPWSYEPKGYRPFPIRTRAVTPENSTKLFDLALGNLKGTPIYVNGDDIAKYYGKWASYPYSL